jgi:hypothetical protein
LAQLDLLLEGRALGGTPPPGMIDQNAAHYEAGHRQEVGAPLPFNILSPRELEKGFIHQCGQLQRVIGALPPHVLAGAFVEIVVEVLSISGEQCTSG